MLYIWSKWMRQWTPCSEHGGWVDVLNRGADPVHVLRLQMRDLGYCTAVVKLKQEGN